MILIVFLLLLSLVYVSAQQLLLTTTTGSIQYSVTSVTSQQRWTITPTNPSSTKIQIIFSALQMQQAELRIFETSLLDSGAVLFNCASCGTMIPSPFFSATGSITISISGIPGVGFTPSSFALQYVASATAPTTQLNNTYVTFNTGTGSIFPYAVGGLLSANYRQQWAIRQSPGTQIIFSFGKFNFGSNCAAQLQLFDGTRADTNALIYQGCANVDTPPGWLYASTGSALVVLTSAGQGIASVDFQLNYFVDVDVFRCGSFVQPAVITDESTIIADGSQSTNVMMRGINCAWQISSGKNVPVSLIMNRVSLKFGSSVVVYDGTSSRGTVLWSANGATLVVPPVITSTGNSLFIQYRSDTTVSVRYFGFEGDYASNYLGSAGSGKGYTQLKMSSALDIRPPGDGVTHSAGVSYLWYVAPTTATGPITFSISLLRLLQPGDELFLLEGVSGNTGGDFGGPVQDLNIGSRTVLASFSTGSSLPFSWVRTVGPSATIIFKSPSPVTATGESFKLSYYADGSNYRCGFTTDPAVLTHPSFILSDGSSSVEGVYGNQMCSWQIQPTNASSVLLFFSRFHLFGGSLKVYVGTLAQNNLYVEIGSTSAVPAPMLIPQAGFSLVYSTQSSASGYGFALTYYGIITPHSFPGDHLVTLTCSSLVSLTLPVNSRTTALASPSTNLTWIVAPSQSNGRIFFALSSLRLSTDCTKSYLEILDGTTLSAPLLGRFCGTTLPSTYAWLQTSSQTALVHFVSDGSTGNTGNFDLAYYSDGPNFHCGFDVNPARMTAPSMIFSDGSGSTNNIYGSQLCEWSIEPNTRSGPITGASETLIVIEFLQCDMGGAKIELFDGASPAAALLWSCDGCTNIPAPIISSSSKVYVRFTSASSAAFGSGFRLVYWTTTATALGRASTAGAATEQVLQLPSDLILTPGTDNRTEAFNLATTATTSTLSFQPFYTAVAGSVETITASSMDGRASSMVLSSASAQQTVCGSILNSGLNQLAQGDVTYQSTQRLGRFLQSTSEYKTTVAIQAAARDPTMDYAAQRDNSMFLVPSVCKYRLNSGSSQAIAIQIEDFTPGQNGHLLIYGGLNGSDALIYDSNAPRKYVANGMFSAFFENGVLRQRAEIIAPCGRATIVLQVNSTAEVTGFGGTDVPYIDHGLRLLYNTIDGDSNQLCTNYYNSLQPKPKEADPNIPVYIGLGAAFGFVLLVATLYYAMKLQKAQGYLLYQNDPTFKPRYVPKIVRAPPSYPKYSSGWDKYMNTFLRKGECVVCKNPSITVIRLQCGHGICLEDIKGYLESALGDVSMFPVKCPMHYMSCEGMIESRIAKRVLTEPQYNRFNEFCDRALYGDGMRCIHCANYVNFPEKMDGVARVICPYCQQNFCIRCKKAWHKGNRCAVDTYDESLEAWKNSSGAQKCPACKKLIEKDDPDTCNHMIHKITDGIPCIRDRTDFCYCCGEEITPDYPHNEVRNKGVNHFPDGVFQRCRTIVAQEKEAERERLRKMRRMKTKIQPFNASRTSSSTVVPTGADTAGDSADEATVENRLLSLATPSAPNGNVSPEALWQLEQSYDIESSPMGSPGRAGLRSSQTTVPGTPATPFLASLGRVISFVDPGRQNMWDEPMAVSSTRPRPVANPAGSSRSNRSNRVVPASSATTAAIAAGGTTGIAARPYAPLEQQMMYQNQIMAGTPSRGSARSRSNSGATTPLLLGSPSARRPRGGTPHTPSTPGTPGSPM